MTTPSIAHQSSQADPAIAHYSHHRTNEKILQLLCAEDLSRHRLLDVGAGEGYLLSLLLGSLARLPGSNPSETLFACDLHPENFKVPEIRCERWQAGQPLPFAAESFDAVTCLETIEHIEDQFQLVREFSRVIRPGGRVLVSTPNVLNLNSRLRYLHSGFLTLFDPLPLQVPDPVHLAGHIHPVGFYYLALMFSRAGFRQVRAHFDFQKRSAIFFAGLLYPALRIWNAGFIRHMRRKYPELYEANEFLLAEMNRWAMLTSRTLILEARK
ncbi:MAG: methyltransferase domain-containing protein [Candidatus Acidiferrales bacterium]